MRMTLLHWPAAVLVYSALLNIELQLLLLLLLQRPSLIVDCPRMINVSHPDALH